jgi:glucokinase
MPKRKPTAADQLSLPVELIARRIYRISGERVMIDSGLADLYQVPTKRLNEAVKRNLDRFPDDFMFQLNND